MNSKSVLIVEDNDRLAKLYQKVLEHSGYQTLAVATSEDAIAALIDFNPGTVFLDWMLSDGTCEPFLDHLKSMPREDVPKIIVVSAEIAYDQLGEYADVVETHYAKPVSIHDMVKQVSSYH